jgi:hypothetical protein
MRFADRPWPARVYHATSAILRRLREEESGFSLVEVIMAAGLMIIVLSASLLTFELLLVSQGAASNRFDSQDRVRTALDRLARDFRNISGASTGATEIEPGQAGAYDLIFRTVSPTGPASGQNPSNIERVRYCIQNSNPAAEVLWFQVQPMTSPTSPFTAPSVCPDYGWATQQNTVVYADSITNQIGSQNRPAFSYTSSNGAIIAVHTDFFVNAKPGNVATETHLSSGVFMRNQDVPPTAAFTATPGSHLITLDGSSSYSPQGSQLTYQWYDTATCGTVQVGQGIVFNYTTDPCPQPPPSGPRNLPLQSGSSHTITLKVFDPAGVEGDAPAQTKTVQ